MFGFKKRKDKDLRILAPAPGRCVPLSSIQDPVFGSGAMGEGVGLVWTGDTVYSPCSGEILLVARTGHAIGIRSDAGMELLVHIGMDTVELNGEGFTVHVRQGARVRPGERLVSVDRTFMEQKGIDLTMPIVVTSGQKLEILAANQDVTKDDELFRLA